MKNKIANILPFASKGYDWKFCSMGGVTRVNIATGEDIAHLGELDQKLWTVLSCPTTGLEFDERTLQLMDSDKDGKIRVNEVIAVAQWLTAALRDNDLILEGRDEIALSDFDTATPEGQELLSAAQLLTKGESETISLSQLADIKAAFDAYLEEKKAKAVTVDERPYGDRTDEVMAAVEAVRDKIDDYFMRCKLVALNEEARKSLDINEEMIAALSNKNLAACMDELSAFPIARPFGGDFLPLDKVNPAWMDKVLTLFHALNVEFVEGETYLILDQWQEACSKIDAYKASLAAKAAAGTEVLDKESADMAGALELMDRFLHFLRDFYKLLRNYVTFADFYSRKEDTEAVFQAGRLFIDQRSCDLCVRVMDMGKHADIASLSGMFLVYCHCVSKVLAKEMDIVAVVTDGDIKGLREGKNAVFYDRQGRDWDAVVTKIVDNPINVKQAFWAPYRKLWNWIQEKINKSAAEKEAKSMDNLTQGADNFTTQMQEAQKQKDGAAAQQKPSTFDIAKFAGIFAAIGMAVGFIASAVTGFVASLNGHWLVGLGLIVLVISGPSMFIAWTKLRKRNLGPVLNANGWAINADAKVNVPFGATLTSVAKYPKLHFDDPFQEKETPAWKKWLYGVGIAIAIAFVYFFVFNKPLPGGETGVRTWLLTKPAEVVEEMFTPTDSVVDSVLELSNGTETL